MHAALDSALVRRLSLLLSDVTGAPAGRLHADSSRDNTEGWDSVANLQFISAIDEEFGVSIPTAAALKLKTLGDVARFLSDAEGGKGKDAAPRTDAPGGRGR